MSRNETSTGAKPQQEPLRPSAMPGQSTEWPQNDELHILDLDSVMGHLAKKFFENHPVPDSDLEFFKSTLKEIHRLGADYKPAKKGRSPAVIELFPDGPTFLERLSDLLPVIWADHRMWWALTRQSPERGDLKGALVAHSILSFYGLQIPFSDSVWSELREQPFKWNYLKFLMECHADGFFYLGTAAAKDELAEDERPFLEEQFLGKLVRKYVVQPSNDWRPLLSRMRLPDRILKRLSQALGSLAADAAWCSKFPGRIIPRRAPMAGHRVRSLSDVKAIEGMVDILRRDPTISDYALAKQCLGRLTAAGRKLAKEAKLLGFYREDLSVKFHKSRGDKNAPTTPA